MVTLNFMIWGVHPVAAMTKAAAADRRSNLNRARIGHLLTLSATREMLSANHTAKPLLVTDENDDCSGDEVRALGIVTPGVAGANEDGKLPIDVGWQRDS
jgi:hypothetical protein